MEGKGKGAASSISTQVFFVWGNCGTELQQQKCNIKPIELQQMCSHDVEEKSRKPRFERFEVDPFVWLEREPVLSQGFFVLLDQDGDFSSADVELADSSDKGGRERNQIRGGKWTIQIRSINIQNANKQTKQQLHSTQTHHDHEVANKVR
jgi:hypothetical protein